MDRKHSLDELLTYGFCSLQHHYRFTLGLPWFVASKETAWARVIRLAAREWFKGQMSPLPQNDRMMMRILTTGHAAVARAFTTSISQKDVAPRAFAGDVVLAFLAFSRYFERGRDIPFGFDIPVLLKVDDFEIEGSIDFAFRRMPGTVSETAAIITLVSNLDPLEELVNYAPLRWGFALAAVRRVLGNQSPVEFKALPVLTSGLHSYVKDENQFQAVPGSTLGDFKAIVRQIHRGIEAKVAIPTSDPSRCKHCPYVSFCSPRHAELKDTTDIKAEVVALERARDRSHMVKWEAESV